MEIRLTQKTRVSKDDMETYQGLLELTGLLSGTRSLKCGGDTERGYSARDNETLERSPKAKVRLGYDVRDDWIYKYM